MLSVQLGSALSVPLIGAVGAAGTAWLRLTAGAVVFLVIARPPLRSIRRIDLPPLIGLGVVSGLVTICFLAAIERIPLGTAVAVEFLGPLTVAAVRSHSVRALSWPGLALIGVLGLTDPRVGRPSVCCSGCSSCPSTQRRFSSYPLPSSSSPAPALNAEAVARSRPTPPEPAAPQPAPQQPTPRRTTP